MKPSPYDLCRRGAIYRMLGQLGTALTDLNQALSIEPTLIDAFWHRHLAYLVINKTPLALRDLDAILRLRRDHARAHKAKAEIYRRMGDKTLAIVNYSQAIRHNPVDHDSYYRWVN